MKLRVSLVASAVTLSLLGVVMIYSASSYSAYYEFHDEFFYVKKQAIALVFGLVLMIAASKLPPEFLKKAKWLVLLLSLALLAMVFIPGLGVTNYGATRWLNLGFTTLQPSEIAKFGLMIFLASFMSEKPPLSFKKLIVPLLCIMSVCVLVILEPNMSITLCILASSLLMLFVAGAPKKWFVVMIVLIAVAVPILIILEPYRVKRLTAFVNPWENPKAEGYQLIQSYYALGAGGLFGLGLFKSRQKYLFLPFAESDFIFSVIGEELGLLGCIAVICLFLVFIYSGTLIALRAEDRYRTLLAIGITGVIAIQSAINIAVVTGSVPPTGLPLPFVSAGGSALATCLFCVGILLNIAKGTPSSPIKFLRHKM